METFPCQSPWATLTVSYLGYVGFIRVLITGFSCLEGLVRLGLLSLSVYVKQCLQGLESVMLPPTYTKSDELEWEMHKC